MALNISRCNYLTPLRFITGLIVYCTNGWIKYIVVIITIVCFLRLTRARSYNSLEACCLRFIPWNKGLVLVCVSFVLQTDLNGRTVKCLCDHLALVGGVHVCDSHLNYDTVERRDVYYRPRIPPRDITWPELACSLATLLVQTDRYTNRQKDRKYRSDSIG